MKKILNILLLMVMTVSLSAQTTLTFEGKDRTGQDWVQLSRVSVHDEDQLWHQQIYYPDTTLVLYVNGTVGVETMCTSSLQMQNNPNPFDGTTDVVLSTPYEGDVTMEITDVNGRAVVETTHALSLPTGTHQFRLTLSAPGTYVLTARQNGHTVSVKMVNAGNGGNNGIEYVGVVETTHALSLQPKSGTRGDGNYPFHNGDLMRYTGYAVVDDVEIESQTVEKAQYGSETIPLKFDVARPEVVTNAASNIAASAATLNGEVTTDNNANVTERGFCYGTAPYPTYSSSTRVEAGNGLGTFSATINGLTAGTTYYTRAYAKNMVGTTYGQQKSFRTLDTLPVVTTTEPSNITATTFTSGGDVLVLNSNSLTARGICWNTTGTPTIADNHTTQSGGLGNFTSNVTGLDCSTIYYVRAYATNGAGTAYGEEYSITTTDSLPIVELLTAQVNATSIIAQSEVLTENCASVTARGVCYSLSPNPTTADSHTTDGSGLGSFTSNITGLTPNTTYYVRAYATNNVGTNYGQQHTYRTMDALPVVTTTEPSNITATTFTSGGEVLILNSANLTARGICWNTTGTPTIADNRTTQSGGVGSFTSQATGLSCGTTYYVRAYATNGAGTAYGEEYSVNTTQELALVTTDNVSGITDNSAVCGGNITHDGCSEVVAHGVCWNTSQNPTIVDSHTMNGNGLGYFTSNLTELIPNTTYYVRAYATNGVGTAYGEQMTFTTECDIVTVTISGSTTINYGQNTTLTASGAVSYHWNTGGNANIITVSPTSSTTYTVTGTNSYGCTSIASVSVIVNPILPTVTTTAVSNIAATSSISGGNVTSDGGATVTARGVCWSTSHNPTISNSHTANGTGMGSFTSNLTGLTAGTTYFVRAYATNSVGTAYGNEMSFTTTVPCGSFILSDRDGNTYNTVQIGNQCWMKENLRTTKYADGTSITQGNSTSTTTAYWYYPNNSSYNMTTYGLLYNWKAVMRNSSSSSSNPSGVQGICPTGWHVPSDAEWTQFTDYVSSQSQYVCGSDNTYIAKALASTTGWTSIASTCAVGNTPSSNNASGFSALPAGYYYGAEDGCFGNSAYFWSATCNGNAYGRSLFFYGAEVTRSSYLPPSGFSVRCLRD